jgi:hypothetical protein
MAQTESSHPNPPSTFNFTFDNALSRWNISSRRWMKNQNLTLGWISVGIVVFNSEDRVLLLQRASHDAMPNRWEPLVDAVGDGETLLRGAVREL